MKSLLKEIETAITLSLKCYMLVGLLVSAKGQSVGDAISAEVTKEERKSMDRI